MAVAPLSFPESIPDSYPIIEGEPAFEANTHLSLERPTNVVTLDGFGYDKATSDSAPTTMAMAGPFRILSDEGVAVMRESARAFRRLNARTEGDPRAGYVKPRGSAYSSRFLREFCACPEVTDFFSDIAGIELIGHAMPTIRSTLVFDPENFEQSQQGWHLDTIGFACVIALHDPATLDGGRFQYFAGTRAQVAEHCACAEEDLIMSVGRLTDLPPDTVRTVAYTAPGYGLLMQGNYVLHRGEPMAEPGERIIFAPGYMAADPSIPDVVQWSEIRRFNSPALVAEYARYKAWRAQTKLAAFVREASLESDAGELKASLLDAMNELQPFVDDVTS